VAIIQTVSAMQQQSNGLVGAAVVARFGKGAKMEALVKELKAELIEWLWITNFAALAAIAVFIFVLFSVADDLEYLSARVNDIDFLVRWGRPIEKLVIEP